MFEETLGPLLIIVNKEPQKKQNPKISSSEITSKGEGFRKECQISW